LQNKKSHSVKAAKWLKKPYFLCSLIFAIVLSRIYWLSWYYIWPCRQLKLCCNFLCDSFAKLQTINNAHKLNTVIYLYHIFTNEQDLKTFVQCLFWHAQATNLIKIWATIEATVISLLDKIRDDQSINMKVF